MPSFNNYCNIASNKEKSNGNTIDTNMLYHDINNLVNYPYP